MSLYGYNFLQSYRPIVTTCDTNKNFCKKICPSSIKLGHRVCATEYYL